MLCRSIPKVLNILASTICSIIWKLKVLSLTLSCFTPFYYILPHSTLLPPALPYCAHVTLLFQHFTLLSPTSPHYPSLYPILPHSTLRFYPTVPCFTLLPPTLSYCVNILHYCPPLYLTIPHFILFYPTLPSCYSLYPIFTPFYSILLSGSTLLPLLYTTVPHFTLLSLILSYFTPLYLILRSLF